MAKLTYVTAHLCLRRSAEVQMLPSDLIVAQGVGKLKPRILTGSVQFQGAPLLRFAVFFGGFHNKQRRKNNRFAQQVFREGEVLDIPSVHVIGDKDSIRKASPSGFRATSFTRY